MELQNGISTYCPHCDKPFTMYPFGQQVIDSDELAALRQRVEALEGALEEIAWGLEQLEPSLTHNERYAARLRALLIPEQPHA